MVVQIKKKKMLLAFICVCITNSIGKEGEKISNSSIEIININLLLHADLSLLFLFVNFEDVIFRLFFFFILLLESNSIFHLFCESLLGSKKCKIQYNN